jgi:hypothetical protein
MEKGHFSGCPGSQTLSFAPKETNADITGKRPSELTQWPVQMHLISPNAAYYQGSDMVLAADCTAFACGDFHKDFMHGKSLAIACPKLDNGIEIYQEKIRALIDIAKINTLTVIIMQVPCCGGLLSVAQTAAKLATRKIPVKCIVIGLQGEVIKEEWIG